MKIALLLALALIQAPFEADIQRFEASDAKNPPKPGGVVFVGSSSIVGWRTLATDFPGVNVINRGFGGSEVADSVRYAKRIVTPYKPSMVVMFAGSNDISAGKTPEKVVADFQEFVRIVRGELPRVRMAYISISPAPSRWGKIEQIKEANRLIREFCNSQDGLAFVDVFSLMLDAKGGPRPELFRADQLHMSPQGYAIWRRAVAPLLPWSP